MVDDEHQQRDQEFDTRSFLPLERNVVIRIAVGAAVVLLLVWAVIATTFAVGYANEPTPDEEYIAWLDYRDVPHEHGDHWVIAAAHSACHRLSTGTVVDYLLWEMRMQSTLTYDEVDGFITAAVNSYCPQYSTSKTRD